MKKIFLMAAFAAAALPTMAQKVNYSVSGTYAKDGQTIYLIERLTDKQIDSTKVADGKFAFTGTADKDALMAINVKNANWSTVFFNDGTPVVINANDSTLTGSPLNERLTKYDIETEALSSAFKAKVAKMTREEIQANQDALMEEMTKAQNAEMAMANKIFQEESNTLIPLAFAELYFIDNGVEAYDKLVKQQTAFANHPQLKAARDRIAALMKPDDSPKTAFIGQPFTDFEMADPDGKMHKVSELVGEGKYVLVDFWASWCGPCRAEMPNVLEAYNKYHDKGFEVIGVSFDTKKDAWVRAVGQLKMPWLQISDLKGFECAAGQIYKVDAIPDNILIDPQGKIIDRALRSKGLHSKLQQIFGE